MLSLLLMGMIVLRAHSAEELTTLTVLMKVLWSFAYRSEVNVHVLLLFGIES